jgi:hypothetical protein
VGLSGGSDYARVSGLAMSWAREMWVPLRRPCRAQADFGQADGYIAGKVRLHYFCVYLPHANRCFVKAYPAGTAETSRNGYVAAFAFSGDDSFAGPMRLC